MRLKTYLRGTVSWGLCLLICISGLTQTVLAANGNAPTKKLPLDTICSLTLEFPCGGLPVELYQVASVDSDVNYTAVGGFETILKKLNQDLEPKATAGEWKTLATTLNSELPGSGIEPVREGKTQLDGGKAVVKFSDLPPGLYLIKPQKTYYDKAERTTYTTEPRLVCLPNWMEAGEAYTWLTDVYANFREKVTAESDTPGPDPGPPPEKPKPTSVSVSKVWLDEAGRPLSDHPASIQVELWGNGKLHETVTLSQENGWSHIWTDLDAKSEWTVREVGVSGYQVSVSTNNGKNYKITNTRPVDPKDPDDPDDNTPDDPPDIPTPPIDIDDPDVPLGPPPKTPGDPYEIIELDDPDVPLADLPQTGQLWWPVPLLAAGGLFLFLIGWVKHRGAQDEE